MSLNCKKWFNVHYLTKENTPGGFIDCFESERDAIECMLNQGEGEYIIVIQFSVCRI